MSALVRRVGWRRLSRLLPIAAILGLGVALLASGLLRRLSLGGLEAHRDGLVRFVAVHPIESLTAYLGAYLVIIIACVPGPAFMSIAGGFLFGPYLGGAAALAALAAGAMVVFLACRTAFGDWAAHRAGATIARIEAGFSRDAFSYLLALRLIPAAPFFIVNLAAGLARVPPSRFALATLIGSAPSAFVFAGLGAGLDSALRRGQRLDASLLTRPDIAAPLAALAVLALAPIGWRFWRSRRR